MSPKIYIMINNAIVTINKKLLLSMRLFLVREDIMLLLILQRLLLSLHFSALILTEHAIS